MNFRAFALRLCLYCTLHVTHLPRIFHHSIQRWRGGGWTLQVLIETLRSIKLLELVTGGLAGVSQSQYLSKVYPSCECGLADLLKSPRVESVQ